ncbi:acyltransferase [Geodermatophilus sp. SYSU D00525]
MRQRDRYIDFLRAAALVRVITFHAFGWAWLPLLFPSMGIMFALGGGLVAGSLDRAGSARAFLRKRIRRLLPPFWVFGGVMVAVMLLLGWQVGQDDGSAPLTWDTAWLWVVPLSDPPASSAGYEWTAPLWYIRVYLWFLLLSPAMLWLFRRWPLRTMSVPVVTMGLVTLGLVNFVGRTHDIVVELCVYACCWMLGFAHHDGTLRRLPLGRTLAGGVALLAAGAWYAFSHQAEYGSYNIDDIPLADMLYCLGAVLVLLRVYPRFGWLDRLPTLGAVVSLFNSRAMTIYLWGNLAIAMAPVVLGATVLARYDTSGPRGMVLEFATAWLLLLVAVLVVGWVEDVAAARRPRLLPWDRVPRARRVVLRGNVVRGAAPGAVDRPAPAEERRSVVRGNVVREAAGTAEEASGRAAPGAGPVPAHRPDRFLKRLVPRPRAPLGPHRAHGAPARH